VRFLPPCPDAEVPYPNNRGHHIFASGFNAGSGDFRWPRRSSAGAPVHWPLFQRPRRNKTMSSLVAREAWNILRWKPHQRCTADLVCWFRATSG
jgi:hypothetical protein